MTKKERLIKIWSLREIWSLRAQVEREDAELVGLWHEGQRPGAVLERAIETSNKLKEAEKWYTRLFGPIPKELPDDYRHEHPLG
jgi:hypothetical protein